MPIHEFRCETCDKITKVLRSFKDYKDPPTLDEQECKCKPTKFIKTLTAPPKATFSGNWGPGWGGGGKGRW